MAELMGVPTYRFRLWAFAIGAAVGGAGGVFFAIAGQPHRPDHLQLPGVDPGRGGGRAGWFGQPARGHPRARSSWCGCPSGSATWPTTGSSASALALVVMMIFRPQGLLAVAAAPGRDRRHRRRRRHERPAHAARGRSAWTRSELMSGDGRAAARASQRVTVRFGGVVAISELDLQRARRRDLRPDRPERGRQDSSFNIITGVLPAERRGRSASTGTAGRAQAPPDHPAGHRPHLPEHPAVPRDVRPGERDGRRRRPAPHRRPRRHPGPAPPPPRGAGRRGPGPGAAGVRRHPGGRATRRPGTCPTATSAGWRSPGPWPPSPGCCCSTSRRPA